MICSILFSHSTTTYFGHIDKYKNVITQYYNIILWHDAWKAEYSITRQRLANTRFRGNG
jgi:hypothetical protein